MGNYKSAAQRKIRVLALETPVPINANVQHLQDIVAGSNAADGLLNIETNAIYSVAAAREFVILGIGLISVAGAVENVVVSTGDTENAETATILTLQLPSSTGIQEWYSVRKILAAGKFLTYNPSGTGLNQIDVVGYEQDV